MTKFKQTIAKWLREQLEERGYNYRKLADEVRSSHPTVVRWMNGIQFPRPDKFKRIVQVITDDIKDTDLFKTAELNEKLFLLRNFEGLKVEEMANGVLVNHALIREWENGTRIPDNNQMRRLMQYFDVTPEQFEVDIKESSFGSRLQDERLILQYTQGELGECIGRTSVAISEFENDKRIPTQEDLVRLSGVFGVSVESMILDEDGLPYEEFAAIYIQLLRESKALS